jgi:DNA topoisomerase-1
VPRDLIILESPNKVRDVEKYARKAGYDARVTATVGHILDLPPMAEGVCVDPSTFTATRLEPRDAGAAARVAQLRSDIAAADRIIVATDPDREGEAIGAQVWSWIPPGKAARATFEEITPAGIERGLAQMRPALKTAAVEASVTRRLVDRLAGWHATDVVFQKLRHHRGISAGRLQSAALRLVVERHREHVAFKPTTTYGVRLRARTKAGADFSVKLVDGERATVVFGTRAEAEAQPVPARLQILTVSAQRKAQKPRPPFEATSWLQVAQKALGLAVKDATKAVQGLFEGGRTTYPRTDTVRVSDEAIEWARREITRRFGGEFVPEAPWVHKDVAGAVQGAHEAIRPTVTEDPAEIEQRRSAEWGDAYALIEARFLASQAAARLVDQTVVTLTGEGGTYSARGEVEVFPGWKSVVRTDAEEEDASPAGGRAPEPDEDGALPALVEGEAVEVLGREIVPQTTRPKPLFSQASIVAELKRLGIGRPSTYPGVVPLLISRGWATEEAPSTNGKRAKKKELPVLVPAAVGCDLYDFLVEAFPGLVDLQWTATLEQALDEIEAGKRSRLDVASAWWARFSSELAAAAALPTRVPQRKDLGPCPKCAAEGRAGRLRLIQGTSSKTGKPFEFAGCDTDTREVQPCGHTAPTEGGELKALLACPACRAPMRPVNRKDGGHSWVCGQHGWFLASKAWQLVTPPPCPQCSQPLVHREKKEVKGEFFWGCFGDKVFLTADRFGRVLDGQARRR